MYRLLVALLFFMIAAPTAAQDSATYTINVRNANVRSCAQTSCSIVTRLKHGTAITILETVEGEQVNSSTQWHRIEVDGKEGYLYSPLAISSSSSPSSPASTSRNGGTISCSLVYRTGRQIVDTAGRWSSPLDQQDEAFFIFTFSNGSTDVETEYVRSNETSATGHLSSGGPDLTLVSGQMQIRDAGNGVLSSAECKVSNA
jgi:uncharacterized protein YgiM (DUF1202 family)